MKAHYWRLLIMVALSFGFMYLFMYAMVDRLANVYPNFNQLYMAGLMAAPMLFIEIFVMREMYPNRTLNFIFAGAAILFGVLCFVLIRQQTAISDHQFLRSMIPHHAGAVLMCEQATIHDPEIKELCSAIITSQESEIDQMKRILDRLDN
jgi:hypothetical protein